MQQTSFNARPQKTICSSREVIQTEKNEDMPLKGKSFWLPGIMVSYIISKEKEIDMGSHYSIVTPSAKQIKF